MLNLGVTRVSVPALTSEVNGMHHKSKHLLSDCSRAWQDGAHLNSSSIRLKASGRVFGRHSALDGTAVHPDLVLFEVELWQAAALTHM